MKEYTTEFIRNVALVGHSSTGKTMMAEAFLYFSGAITRMGKVEDGSTASDFDQEENRRTLSLYTSVIPIEHKNTKLNILDAPGYTDFVGEVISALSVADGAVVLIDSLAGVEVGTEIAWRYCDEFKLPRIVVINKMDRDNANLEKVMASLNEFSEARMIKVQLPWGERGDFKGVIDLLSNKAYEADGKKAVDIPAEFADAAEEARHELIEAAAEGDDALLEKYFEGEELSDSEIASGLKKVFMAGDYVPVFVAAAGNEIGVGPLLDALVSLMPSPADRPAVVAQGAKGEEELIASDTEPLAAYVWKTTADPFVGKQTFFRIYSGSIEGDSRVWNQKRETEERFGSVNIPVGKDQNIVKVIHAGDIASVPKLSETATGDTFCLKGHPLTLPVPDYPTGLFRVAIVPKTQADAAKISPTLTRLCEEDMTLDWYNEKATRQTILKGMGNQHIDVAIRRAEAKLQVGLETIEPRIPYREGITKEATASYRHKKQSGGSGQFGEVHITIDTYPEGDFELTWDVFGGAISQSYEPAIRKGILSVMKDGAIAGYPMQNVKVSVFDGKEHPVDSKPVAFESAARGAFKAAVKDAGPVLYEPIMKVRITVPDANMGDVIGDLNTRRGRMQGTDAERGLTTVIADVPLAEMLNYTSQLRSITGGRGYFMMEFDRYEIVPTHVADEVIAAAKSEEEED
ncbi:MAG: elongation factor G [Anaerolineales bacterium]|uniref:Elongation factor G n=1 Tax=Candidatus Desulfolinea nitratireducens TaxID=2841698 RepID=A0A8J6NHJ5_9CHLR|nr:elongation factor G [Candidatus Desulfolinea nitratireducens]MBL6960723.1 elongation factor G [Anaerolineales bacterium]